MKKNNTTTAIAAILAVVMLLTVLTGCKSNTPSVADAPQSSSNTTQSGPSKPSEPAKPAEATGNEGDLVDPDEGGLTETDPVEETGSVHGMDYKVIGPVSIVEESPLLDTLSAEDRDLILQMNATSLKNYFQKYTDGEKKLFAEFTFDTMRIDFDRRIIEHGSDMKYTDPAIASFPEMFENCRYAYGMFLSGFWIKQDDDIVWDTVLAEKCVGYFPGTEISFPTNSRLPYNITPDFNANTTTITAPFVVPFAYQIYSYVPVDNGNHDLTMVYVEMYDLYSNLKDSPDFSRFERYMAFGVNINAQGLAPRPRDFYWVASPISPNASMALDELNNSPDLVQLQPYPADLLKIFD